MGRLATVATAGTITDHNRISVDDTRDGLVVGTPFGRKLSDQEILAGDWGTILAEAGFTVTTGWDDHDGFWTAEVAEADYGILTDYTTGQAIRPATEREHFLSSEASPAGVFVSDDDPARAVFVAGGPERATR